MNMSNEEYQKYVMAMAKSSPTAKNLVWAFCVGGGICALGQGLSTLYERWGAGENALPLVSLTLVFVAALLTGLGVFDDFPTPWCPRPWSFKVRVASPELGPSCSLWPGRFWPTGCLPAWCTGASISCSDERFALPPPWERHVLPHGDFYLCCAK